MNKHKTWITAGKDNVVREWDINMSGSSKCLIETYSGHENMVMDVCEIHQPLSIATASLDKTIVIYNLIER